MASKKQNYVSPIANKLEKENIKLKKEIELLKSKLNQVKDRHSAIEIAKDMLGLYDSHTDEFFGYDQSLASIDDDDEVEFDMFFQDGTVFKLSLTKISK